MRDCVGRRQCGKERNERTHQRTHARRAPAAAAVDAAVVTGRGPGCVRELYNHNKQRLRKKSPNNISEKRQYIIADTSELNVLILFL
jgi:hypothetical protein